MNTDIAYSSVDKRKMLIVEDDRNDQVLLSKRIRSVNESVGIDIIDSARKFNSKEKYDLVLLDLNIKDCFGPQTVKDLRTHVKDSTVIVITSIGSDLTRDECKKNGADHFFLKHELVDDGFKNLLQKHLN